MRILHYFLGFPPYRTGGLTKYALDLMQGQAEQGNHVMALWPGKMRLRGGEPSFGKPNRRIVGAGAIESYELINPLPVPLDEGIRAFSVYTKPCDRKRYEAFLAEVKPDIIHIHTLMGLHREIVQAAQHLQIKTIFTTHDYFGICPRATLYKNGAACLDDHGCRDCLQCNRNALSYRKIQLLQSGLYRNWKDTPLVRAMRKKHRNTFFAEAGAPVAPEKNIQCEKEAYRKLRAYYTEMLEQMDFIHFNSSLTEEIYRKYLTPKAGRVLSITHRNITDNRGSSGWKPSKRLRITLLSPARAYKGFYVLWQALAQLWEHKQLDFELKVFGPVGEKAPYMKVEEAGYAYGDLQKILADTDLVVAPSVCYETFGFTVLEALSFGVPVIVSNHVGAKDIIGSGGIVVEAGSVSALKAALLEMTEAKQRELRHNIQTRLTIREWEDFLEEHWELYREILK